MALLEGKVAIVTGIAKGGTGWAIATTFLHEGARLVVSDIARKTLEEAIEELGQIGPVVGSLADVGRRDDAQGTVRQAISQHGRLDILVNNAVFSTPGVGLEEIDDRSIERTLGASLFGTIHHMQAAFPHLRNHGGSIINFGSRAGIDGTAGLSIYAATKEGVRGLSRSAAREWGKFGIRVNVLCPAVLSPAARTYWESVPELDARHMQEIALGYRGDALQDIAPVALFLASDQARYVTGQTINVDGGQAML